MSVGEKVLGKSEDYYFSIKYLGMSDYGSRRFITDVFDNTGKFIKEVKCSGRNYNDVILYCLSVI